MESGQQSLFGVTSLPYHAAYPQWKFKNSCSKKGQAASFRAFEQHVSTEPSKLYSGLGDPTCIVYPSVSESHSVAFGLRATLGISLFYDRDLQAGMAMLARWKSQPWPSVASVLMALPGH